MSDHDALLQAVLAAPEDDLPRLVFADFLEESGHPALVARAAYIRLQIEAEQLPNPHPARTDLTRQAVALRGSFADEVDQALDRRPEWARGWAGIIVRRRGFAADVRTDLDRLRVVAECLMPVAPIQGLHVELLGPAAHQAVVAPPLARLRRLQFGPNLGEMTQPPYAAEDLLRSPNLTGLRELAAAGNQLTDWWLVWAGRLFAQTAFARTLEVLDLSDNQLTDAGANTLAAAPGLDGLRVLNLSGNRLTQAGVALLRRRFGERVVV